MSQTANIKNEVFQIRAYEIDSRGKASVQSLCNYFNEIAGNHAQALGVSIETLFAKKKTWILSRLHVNIKRYPIWREEIRIETWPSGVSGMYALRDFLIFDGQEQIIGKATTSWMMLDLIKRKPIVMPDFIKSIEIPKKERAINDKFDRLAKLKKIDDEKHFYVRLSDLDLNQHVNSVNYIEWAVETIPLKIWQKQCVSELEISFRAETNYGDRIISQTQHIEKKQKNIFLHKLLRESDQREVAILKTSWVEDL